MSAKHDDVWQFAQDKLTSAIHVATEIGLLENRSARDIYAKSAGQSITDFPRITEMPVGYGDVQWAAILFVDMRDSTSRCELYGARLTYLTMHTYLATMAYLVKEYDGVVVGLRGDGLFAAFGLGDDGKNPENIDYSKCVQSAALCGRAMIEAVDNVIAPLLADYVPASCATTYKRPIVGCGVDAEKVVLTRIGFLSANEVTAYGTAVNKAAKLCGTNGDVVITPATERLFPVGEGGTLSFAKKEHMDGLRVVFPPGYKELK